MTRWGLVVGLLAVSSAAANAQVCDEGFCKKLVVAAAANPFDGNWSEIVTGESANCAGTVNTTFQVENGRLIQSGSGGTVSRNGSARGSGTGDGYILTWTGHFSGNSASGRYRRSDGCVGSWQATRQ
jgi:hypothetical protein